MCVGDGNATGADEAGSGDVRCTINTQLEQRKPRMHALVRPATSVAHRSSTHHAVGCCMLSVRSL